MPDHNLAIVIAISKYDKAGQLPACDTDGALVNAILSSSGKYLQENTLSIIGAGTSAEIKSKLAEFVDRHKGSSPGEVFFYFSGHGSFSNDEFYFLCTDYDPSKRHQTTLSNTELDEMLRSLGQKLTIKVVDACQSGVQYVKEGEVISKALEKTKAYFGECYFMFSSRRDQKSFQDHDLSFFTRVNASNFA